MAGLVVVGAHLALQPEGATRRLAPRVGAGPALAKGCSRPLAAAGCEASLRLQRLLAETKEPPRWGFHRPRCGLYSCQKLRSRRERPRGRPLAQAVRWLAASPTPATLRHMRLGRETSPPRSCRPLQLNTPRAGEP